MTTPIADDINIETDFLPVETMLNVTRPSALSWLCGVAALLLVCCAPALVIVAWRWAL